MVNVANRRTVNTFSNYLTRRIESNGKKYLARIRCAMWGLQRMQLERLLTMGLSPEVEKVVRAELANTGRTTK